jgi:SAM-dependent methyltransferase
LSEKIWLDRLEATRPYQRLRYAMNRELASFFQREVFAGHTNLRIAEVACGSGFAAHLLAQHNEVSLSLAADLNQEDFRQANVPDFRATFVLMDLFRPSAKAASMDLVWNSSSVEELEEPEKAVRAMAWLAKPGGFVFVGVPSNTGPAGWLRLLPSRRTRSWLGRVYTRSDLRQLLTAAGLTVKKETSYFFGTFIGVLAEKSG